MLFGIADDGYSNAEHFRELAFGHCVGGVISAFGVDVWLKFAEQRIYIEFVEDDDVIHGAKRSDERGTRTFGEDGPAVALQFPCAGIGVDSDYEEIAFGARGFQIADVAHMQKVENTIGKDNFAPGAAVLFENRVKSIAGNNFFAGVHAC